MRLTENPAFNHILNIPYAVPSLKPIISIKVISYIFIVLLYYNIKQ